MKETMQTNGGLSRREVDERLAQFGRNALPEPRPRPLWQRLLDQFKNPLIYILLVALVFDLALWVRAGRTEFPLEAVAIGLILLLNAALGIYQERKAEAALARLKKLSAPQVWARRDGQWVQIPGEELVPDDVIRLEAGDRIPADGQSVVNENASADESIVTGESLPVDKTLGDTFLSGTLLVRGRVHLKVTGTGLKSTLGKLAKMLGDTKREDTPLERRLKVFGNRIARWVIGLAATMVCIGMLMEGVDHIAEVIMFSVALAVAAVPEGLPAILTFTLALGVERMARRKAIVRKLAAVEALGSVTVIVTDKTGTITENRMHVHEIESPNMEDMWRAMVLANDADEGVGDPLDVALIQYASQQGHDPEELNQKNPRVSSKPFDSEWKFMRVTVRAAEGETSFLKGAPEVLLARSRIDSSSTKKWTQKVADYARDGFRVVGAAKGQGDNEENLEFLGLVAFWDPPRAEVPDAIAAAKSAGIRVMMVSGDHPATALTIARKVGIEGDRALTGADFEKADEETLRRDLTRVNVCARFLPEHKLKLVEWLQKNGEVVAMTGDGVNDAPALNRSDVGVAMGQRGSDVSREVGDLVLLDDNFATIVAATEEGRNIYENIQKFIRYLLSTNLSEVLVVAIGMILSYLLNLRDEKGGWLLPLTAVQILWINLVTDGLPALALALDRNPGAMQSVPRPRSSQLLDGPSARFIIVSGTIKAILALAILGSVPLMGFGHDVARTATFQFLAVGQLFFVYPARHTAKRPLPNPTLTGVVIFGVLLQIAIGLIPISANALGLAPLSALLWAVVFGAALLAWGSAELVNRTMFQDASEPQASAKEIAG